MTDNDPSILWQIYLEVSDLDSACALQDRRLFPFDIACVDSLDAIGAVYGSCW